MTKKKLKGKGDNNDFTEQILQQKKNPTKKSGGVTVVEGILGVSPVSWRRSVLDDLSFLNISGFLNLNSWNFSSVVK